MATANTKRRLVTSIHNLSPEQLAEVKALYPNKTVWMYTGDLWEDVRHYPVMKLIDVLIDGPFIEELKDEKYPWAGSTNQRVIDVNKSYENNSVILYDPR